MPPRRSSIREAAAAQPTTPENPIIMNHTPIYITRDDYSKLRLLVTTALYSNASSALRKLRDELDRAAVIESAAIPEGVVTMHSSVEFEALESGEVEEYTLTFSDLADVEEKRLSILAPMELR